MKHNQLTVVGTVYAEGSDIAWRDGVDRWGLPRYRHARIRSLDDIHVLDGTDVALGWEHTDAIGRVRYLERQAHQIVAVGTIDRPNPNIDWTDSTWFFSLGGKQVHDDDDVYSTITWATINEVSLVRNPGAVRNQPARVYARAWGEIGVEFNDMDKLVAARAYRHHGRAVIVDVRPRPARPAAAARQDDDDRLARHVARSVMTQHERELLGFDPPLSTNPTITARPTRHYRPNIGKVTHIDGRPLDR